MVPLGEVPGIVPKSIAAHILGYLNVNAEVLSPLRHPDYAYDPRRLQYNAGAVLKALESHSFGRYEKVIGVLDVDLFVPIFTYVFGEAKQGGKYALVSLNRLRKGHGEGAFVPEPIYLERAAKVALHELGHLYDLHHCSDSRCLMHFSGGLEYLDRIPLYFCRYCSVFMRDALSRPRHRRSKG